MKKMLPMLLLMSGVSAIAVAQTLPPATGSDTGVGVGGSGSQTMSFGSLDKNGDGKLTKTEAKSSEVVSAAFDKADKNGDSVLTKTEYDAYFGTH